MKTIHVELWQWLEMIRHLPKLSCQCPTFCSIAVPMAPAFIDLQNEVPQIPVVTFRLSFEKDPGFIPSWKPTATIVISSEVTDLEQKPQ